MKTIAFVEGDDEEEGKRDTYDGGKGVDGYELAVVDSG